MNNHDSCRTVLDPGADQLFLWDSVRQNGRSRQLVSNQKHKNLHFSMVPVGIQQLHHFLLMLIHLISAHTSSKACCSLPFIPSQNCFAGIHMYHCGANGIRYHRCCRTKHDGGRRRAPWASINKDSISPIKFSGFQSCGNCQQKLRANEEIGGRLLWLWSVFWITVQRKKTIFVIVN